MKKPPNGIEALLRESGGTVPSEVAGAFLDAAKAWAGLSEKLMFELEKTGLTALDPELADDYRQACEDEMRRYRELAAVANQEPVG